MTGNLDMGDHSIQKVGDPVNSDDVATKNYVDAEVGYISTPFLKLDGTRAMTGNLNMNTHKISNVVNPEFDADVVNKQYLENKLIESHLQPSGPSNIFHFLMNDTSKFSSIREIIIGSFSDVEKVAHRSNKKALSILLQNDLQTVSYSARLGLDMTSLSVGDYTLVMEFYWPEKFNIYTYADSTPTNIVDKQTIKNFSNYQKLYLQFTKKNTNSPNNLIMEIRGELSTSNQQSDATNTKDAINKGQLDEFKNEFDRYRFFVKNHSFLDIFSYLVFDFNEPGKFIVKFFNRDPYISGIASNETPSLTISSTLNKRISYNNFEPKKGIQFSSSHRLIMELDYNVDEHSSYTLLIIMTLKDNLKISFIEPTQGLISYYPVYIVNKVLRTLSIQTSNNNYTHSQQLH